MIRWGSHIVPCYRFRKFLLTSIIDVWCAGLVPRGRDLAQSFPPTGFLNADPACGHPGALDAVMGGPNHCDGDPNPDISK